MNDDMIDSLIDQEEIVRSKLLTKFDKEVLDKRIIGLVEDVKIGYMFSHWYWIIWGILSSKNPQVNFGYIEFAWERYNDYKELKEKMFK